METTKSKSMDGEKLLPGTPGAVTYDGQVLDIMLRAWLGKITGWLSPASFGLAFFDWLSHLSISPAKQLDIVRKAQHETMQLALYASQNFDQSCKPCVETRPSDSRFDSPSWDIFPFNLYAQSFLLCQQLLDEATSSIRGVSRHHQQVVNFATRQMLDVYSPSNFPLTNPEVLLATFAQGGRNFISGAQNFFADYIRSICNQPPAGTEQFQVGVNLGITPGKVIYRNHLIELIQYTPTTAKVYAEPILIVPAWIMKYYILDLSPHNSLVKYLVAKGHTVFMISWKNPSSADRDLEFEDYVDLGIINAMDAINAIIPKQKIHAVGYCLGGTLLMVTAAALANTSDERLKSITLFAAQVDFRDAGELQLFIDQSQITYLEDIMWERGYLDGSQMAGAFSMLHSNDLIWSRMVHDYLLGKRRPINDLMAWDLDTTRLPFRMHSEYLHSLFLNNDLSQGRFKLWKKRIALIDINIPIFAVGTRTDHVSPWKSVYKVYLFTDTEFTFVLTSGGHNAGIVSEPGHRGRVYQMTTRKRGDRHIHSETWQETAPEYDGSWWPAWEKWLSERSGDQVTPPSMGNAKKGYPPLDDAPGTYVLQK